MKRDSFFRKALLALTLASVTTLAAAHAKSERKTPEVYSANEPGVTSYATPEDEIPVVTSSEVSFPTPPVVAPAPTVTLTPAKAPVPDAAPPASAPVAKKQIPFDAVPANQIDSIAKRLRIVEELLRKHGRAYDYRVLTLRDLEKILSELEPAAAKLAPTEL